VYPANYRSFDKPVDHFTVMPYLTEPAQSFSSDEAPAVNVAEPQAAGWFIGAVICVIAGWLGSAAIAVQIEYYDGLSAIANARYFLGTTDRYVADRAPMMALILMPAELFRTAFGLHPLDVRPHHGFLALLHGAYLIATYRLLSQVFGRSWTVFAAWAAAIPNFVFFSYSPFVSHDIIPGVLLLSMLIWCDRFFGHPSYRLWIGLVALGAIAALVKQTFGIFWILLLLAALFQCGKSHGKEPRTTFMKLACGALASGLITWFVLGWILGNADPRSPLLIRPLQNLHYLSKVYEGTNAVFPLWIYLRNGPAYGWLALLLVVPGLVMSLRGSRIQQSMAIAWLGGLAFLHLLPLREVRYMAFLAPLTACLLVPALRLVAQWKFALVAALLVLALDVGRGALEAIQIFHPFYTSGIERRFFNLLDDRANRRRPVLVNTPMLNFMAPIPSPFAADRYHRIFHFGVVHLRSIYDCQDLRVIADERSALRSVSTCPDGSILYYASQVLARGPSWSSGASVGDPGFIQCSSICRSQAVRLGETSSNDQADSEAIAVVRLSAPDERPLIIQGEPCAAAPPGELFPVLRIKSMERSYWLRRTGPDSYVVSGMRQSDSIEGAQGAAIRRFEIDRGVWTNAAADR
jgi:hypothetical protein